MRTWKLTLLLLLMLAPPSLAQQGPLNVQISVSNGATNLSTSARGEVQDPAIRVYLDLSNSSGETLQISRIACTFFDGDGNQVGQDQTQPLTLRGREKNSAILFYANGGLLYAFKAVGTIEYQQDGQSYSVPIDVDQTSISNSPDLNY